MYCMNVLYRKQSAFWLKIYTYIIQFDGCNHGFSIGIGHGCKYYWKNIIPQLWHSFNIYKTTMNVHSIPCAAAVIPNSSEVKSRGCDDMPKVRFWCISKHNTKTDFYKQHKSIKIYRHESIQIAWVLKK